MDILSIKDVYYKVGNTDIINGISIDIEEGDCISLVGQSGSGKSTLLKLIADLIPISEGRIFFKGKDYSSLNPLDLRKKISYCTQNAYLFGENVYENLYFPFKLRNKDMDEKKIIDLLERFSLDRSYLEKSVNSLSGGEKQRVGIIRNLLFTPEIILLDEATSALDKENAYKVEEYIKDVNDRGATVLWITHDLNQSTRIFNKRIVVSEGKVDRIEVIK